MQPGKLQIACPTCGKDVLRAPGRPAPFFPFCSERCKLVDLGKWFDEKHRIEGSVTEKGDAEREAEERG